MRDTFVHMTQETKWLCFVFIFLVVFIDGAPAV